MEWWQVLLEHALQLTIAIVLPVAMHLINQQLKQRKLEFLSGVVDKAVLGGVHYAEEQARKALNDGKEKTPAALKLDMALDYAQAQLQQSGYDQVARDKLIQLIESKLYKERGILVLEEKRMLE